MPIKPACDSLTKPSGQIWLCMYTCKTSTGHQTAVAHCLDVESLLGLLIAGVHGEEEQLVLPEAGCKGSEQPRGLLLISEQHQLGLTHCATKRAFDVAAADARHNVWEGCHSKGMQFLGCPVTCSIFSLDFAVFEAVFEAVSAPLLQDCLGFLHM